MTSLTIFLTRVFGVLWCLSQDDSLLLRLCSLLPRRQYVHKNHCPAHSVLIRAHWEHLLQLFYPGWLLHAKALQESVSRLAASIVFTFKNTSRRLASSSTSSQSLSAFREVWGTQRRQRRQKSYWYEFDRESSLKKKWVRFSLSRSRLFTLIAYFF